jgi:outer membrane PBP1 activator LpoA protein
MHGFLLLSQTNFPVYNFMDVNFITLFKLKCINFFYIALLLMTVFISGCSTQTRVDKTKDTPETVSKEVTVTATAEEKLALAQLLNSQLPTDLQLQLNQQAQITELLVDASELFFQQQNFPKALWLANNTTELAAGNHQNTYRLLLVKASSLHALNYHQQAYQQLQLAHELVSYTNSDNTAAPLELTLNYYLILSDVLTAQEKTVPALTAQLNAYALNNHSSTDDTLAIWHKLELLTQWQITQLVNSKPPFAKGWQELLDYSHKFGANTGQFSRYLSLWQQHNPTHPATSIIEQLRTLNSTQNTIENKIENIAILLPLSGNQVNAGLAAQQGILAAYKNNTNSNLHFIDTNQVDWQTIAPHFTGLSIDHVIGPLLRSNVETFLELSMQEAPLQVPTLLLNLPSQHSLTKNQVALSMHPEDEAIQAAATLSQKNYINPIILSHQDNVSKRIALAFSQQWQKSTGDSVDIVYFSQGKQMQTSLKESLDINASQARIAQLNARLKHTIQSEPRNRRDIDMIYLVGSASQTRLIKPYIDVNTSPFADIIPVYASSRSHSNFNDKNNSSSTNDLQGLTFTQIPWLLTSKQQNKALAKLSDKLWPKRTDSLSRIFAMGFDSYNLLSKVFKMQQAPYIRHFGQTGMLKLNSESILTRSLIWGRYQNDRVMQIAMD